MAIEYKLKAPVLPDASSNVDDVWVIKKALAGAGYYKEPKHGLTPYPDAELFRGIREFQRTSGLRVDGIMRPGGETERYMEGLFVRSPIYRCTTAEHPTVASIRLRFAPNVGTKGCDDFASVANRHSTV